MKKLSAADHKLKGTYRKDRHQPQPPADHDGYALPDWLDHDAAVVWHSVVDSLALPPSPAERCTIEQYAVLKARLQADTDAFTPAEHGQLRHLVREVREIAERIQDQTAEAATDKDNPWAEFARRNKEAQARTAPPADGKPDFAQWQASRKRRTAPPDDMPPDAA